MKRSIYTKFIFIYIVAAILSFAFVAIGTSRLVTTHMTEKKAGSLYTEASLLSNDYAADYYRSRTASSLETVYSHLDVLATYLDADIWMIDLDGKVILESGKKLVDPEKNTHVMETFDPTSFGTSYYMIGDFFGEFSEETLSVISPINYNYRVRGYLVIHTAMHSLRAQSEEVLNIMYLTLAVLLLIALIVLFIYGHII